MGLTAFTRRLTAWIAVLTMLLAALAPAVSHAVAAHQGSPSLWSEICTAVGIKLVKIDTKAKSSSSETQLHIEHCPFCSSYTGAVGLPPDDAPFMFVTDAKDSLPILYYRSPRPLFIWAAAQSRAPPSRS